MGTHDDTQERETKTFSTWAKNTFRIADATEFIEHELKRAGRNHIEDNVPSRIHTKSELYSEIGLRVSKNQNTVRAEKGVSEAMKFANYINQLSDESFISLMGDIQIYPRPEHLSTPNKLEAWVEHEKQTTKAKKCIALQSKYGDSARDSSIGKGAATGAVAGAAGAVIGAARGAFGGATNGIGKAFRNHGNDGLVWAIPYAVTHALGRGLKRGAQFAGIAGAAGAAWGVKGARASGTDKTQMAEVYARAMRIADESFIEKKQSSPHPIEEEKTPKLSEALKEQNILSQAERITLARQSQNNKVGRN